jgi:endonuclease/exonuclease/phosphatase family metal-dependent hydrolase
VRVLTWNLWWRFADWSDRRKAIRQVLAETEPDLCGLQEVWSDDTENLAGWLADELGLHWTWAPAPQPHPWQGRIDEPDIGFGVAILSRWPIVEPRFEELPGDRGRMVLSALVDAPHGPVPFATVHLSALAGRSALRCRQVRRICEVIAQRPADGHPPVLTGDFNALPDSDELRLLGGDLTDPVVPGQVLLDAWLFAEPGDPGYTWDRRNPHVAEGPEPSGRIDQIRVGLRYTSRGPGHVRSVRLAGNAPIEGIWPSDHAAVVAELTDGA